jgi:protein-S-isoprenylcysteine O-methyltransferase Ste14
VRTRATSAATSGRPTAGGSVALVHPFTAAPPAARLLLVVSAVVWLLVELRESTNHRPEATTSDRGSRMYIRVASAVGVVGAVVLTRNVSSARISPDVAWVGLVVFWCGMALRFWSFRALGRYFTFTVQTSADQPVITSGPYRFVRHPSYAAVLLMVMGVGLFLGSWWSFAWLTASVFCGLFFRIRVEEHALLLQLGDRYDTYAANHKRLVPFIW